MFISILVWFESEESLPSEEAGEQAATTLLKCRKGKVSFFRDVQRKLSIPREITIGQEFSEKATFKGTTVEQTESSKRRW